MHDNAKQDTQCGQPQACAWPISQKLRKSKTGTSLTQKCLYLWENHCTRQKEILSDAILMDYFYMIQTSLVLANHRENPTANLQKQRATAQANTHFGGKTCVSSDVAPWGLVRVQWSPPLENLPCSFCWGGWKWSIAHGHSRYLDVQVWKRSQILQLPV